MFCTVCAVAPGPLCTNCQNLLEDSQPKFPQGSTLYRYRGILRDLVLRAKVSGERRALELLLNLWENHPRTQNELTQAECIIPAPSSLRGRLRGSQDLAYLAAAHLSRSSGLPLQQLPLRTYLRFKKRSYQKGRDALVLTFPENVDRVPALLLDDVLTSGHTLKTLAFGAAINYRCRFLTLGDAYREPTKPS